MQDKETNSLWSHITGEALEGPMKGKQLENLPVVQTIWSDWVKQYPNTKLLRKEREVRSSRYERYFKDPDRNGMFRAKLLNERMPGKSMVHGLVSGPHALAVADAKLDRSALLNATVGDDPVMIVRAADGGVRAYTAIVKGKKLDFQQTGSPSVVRDKETGSTWDMEKGLCTAGKLKGATLKEVVVHTAFWFAWISFYPNTEVLD